jgi:hypothetical protein
MIRILIVLILIMISSCKKDEIIPIKVSMPPKVTEIKKERKVPLKKRKFKLFKRKKYKGFKIISRTF